MRGVLRIPPTAVGKGKSVCFLECAMTEEDIEHTGVQSVSLDNHATETAYAPVWLWNTSWGPPKKMH